MFVIKFVQKGLGFSDVFYFPVHSLDAAKDLLSILFQNLMTSEQLHATNSVGLFRRRIMVFF